MSSVSFGVDVPLAPGVPLLLTISDRESCGLFEPLMALPLMLPLSRTPMRRVKGNEWKCQQSCFKTLNLCGANLSTTSRETRPAAVQLTFSAFLRYISLLSGRAGEL